MVLLFWGFQKTYFMRCTIFLSVLPTSAHASQFSTLVFNVLVVKFLGPRSLIWYDRQPAGCTLKQCYFWFLNWTFGERCVSRQQQKWLPIKNYKKTNPLLPRKSWNCQQHTWASKFGHQTIQFTSIYIANNPNDFLTFHFSAINAGEKLKPRP